MSKEALKALNRKRGAVKAQLTRIKNFMNNPDEKDKTHIESKLDTLKSLRIKLSDIRDEYYEVVADDSDLEPLESEILDLEDDCEDIQKILDKETRKTYELNLASTELPKWEDFMNFLLKRCLILENIQANNATAFPSERIHETKSFLDKLDPAVSSHKVALCKSSRNCPNCSKRHNSLLCKNFDRNVGSQRSPGSETLPNMEPRITTPTLNVNSECFQPKQTVESFKKGGKFMGYSKGHSTMLLSTAVVYCQNSRGEVFPLRALLNSGSQSNLITREAALALGLSVKE
ncbi:DUF1758 domain-containing protein [Trichonephila clavipes]|nr:DUF1758 domain-containing protein [Trichonephila clavipes]